MIGLPTGTRVWPGAGVTDMRNCAEPFSDEVFVFSVRSGDLMKLVWFDGAGLCLFANRLERGSVVMVADVERGGGAGRGTAVDVAGRH